MLIRYVYIVFIGLLLAVFVGVGIAAFYKGPKAPEYPVSLKYPEFEQTKDVPATVSAQRRADMEENDAKQKEFQVKREEYDRNVSIISLIAAVIMLVLSLTSFKKILVIADGVLLGGVLTLGYSIVRGFGSNDDIFRFLVVSAGLLVAMGLGYIKFVRPLEKKG